MKHFFALLMLISIAMISSCQKQDSAAEQQFAQRKAELDARERSLDEREKALAEREKAIASARSVPSDAQARSPARDAAQLKAEREKSLQQLPPDLQGLIATPHRDETQATAECKSDSPRDSVGWKTFKERGWLTQSSLSERMPHRRLHLRQTRVLRHLRRLRLSNSSRHLRPEANCPPMAGWPASLRAYWSVSIESTLLSRRIALILGKRSARPLA